MRNFPTMEFRTLTVSRIGNNTYYRVTIPKLWCDLIEINEDDAKVQLELDIKDQSIKIKKINMEVR